LWSCFSRLREERLVSLKGKAKEKRENGDELLVLLLVLLHFSGGDDGSGGSCWDGGLYGRSKRTGSVEEMPPPSPSLDSEVARKDDIPVPQPA
jgi:hypothetical protein